MVGWAHATTCRPAVGAGRSDAMTTPDTSMGLPPRPVDVYRIFHAEEPGGEPFIGSERISRPGPAIPASGA